MKGDKLALDCGIQEIGEGMKEVEFSGLERLKEKDLLGFGEEIDAIRRYRPMTTSFPLNEVKDELRDFRSPDDDKAVRVFGSFFSHGESDFPACHCKARAGRDNKLGYTFEEDRHQGQLTEDGGPFETSDFWFQEDLEVFFSGAIDSFGSGSEGSELLVARGTSDDFSDEPGVLFSGHMFDEAVVVHKVGAGLRIFF